MCCVVEMWELPRVKKGSHWPGQSVCEGGAGREQAKAQSMGKEEGVEKWRQVGPEMRVCLWNQRE